MSCRIVVVALVAWLAGGARGQDQAPPPPAAPPPASEEPAGRAAPAEPSEPADAPADRPDDGDDNSNPDDAKDGKDAGANPDAADDEKPPAADLEQAPAPKPPATRPAPPRSRRADEAALRGELKTLARALQEGKAEGIKRVVYAANPTERKMVDAMAAFAVQIAGLYKAAAKAFGEEDARALTGGLVAEISRIDDAEVAIDGDTATVRYRQPAPPAPADGNPARPDGRQTPESEAPVAMVLKRVDGRWRVPMSELSKDATPADIEQRLADLDVQTRLVRDLIKEIAQGKHRTADKAADAWQARVMQALTPGKPAEAKGGRGTGRQAGGGEGEKGGTGKGGRRKQGERDDASADPADQPDQNPAREPAPETK